MGSGAVLVREVGELLGVEGLRAAEGGERQRDFRLVLIREGLTKSGRYFTRRAVEQMKKEPATGVLAEARRVLSEVQETQFRNAAGRVLEEHLAAAEKLPESAKAKLRRHLEPDGSRYAGVEAYGQIVEAAVREEAVVVKDVRDSAREELEAGRRGTTQPRPCSRAPARQGESCATGKPGGAARGGGVYQYWLWVP